MLGLNLRDDVVNACLSTINLECGVEVDGCDSRNLAVTRTPNPQEDRFE